MTVYVQICEHRMQIPAVNTGTYNGSIILLLCEPHMMLGDISREGFSHVWNLVRSCQGTQSSRRRDPTRDCLPA